MTYASLRELEQIRLASVVATGQRGTTAEAVCIPWVGVEDAAAFARLLALELVRLDRRGDQFVYVATPAGVARSGPQNTI
jgi:hypothetical protein